MPPRDPKPANSGRKPKPKPNLDVQEPALTAMLEKYCDLRRRGFGQQAIQTKANWPRHYPSLLLKEAQRREMPSSQQSQQQAVTEWLLAMFDAGTELRVIQRMSAFTGQQTNKQLQTALDAASGPSPTDIIIRNPDGEPTRVSWLDLNGELMHRPFDGAFPANYPADLAVRQCTDRRGREAHRHHETPPSPECRTTPTPKMRQEIQVAHRQRSQVPVASHETLRILASLHPQRGRTPGQQPRHLLHDRSRLPDTGAFQRRKGPVHPSVATNWVHHPEHRKRLVHARRAAWRTPPAETKQQKGYLNQHS